MKRLFLIVTMISTIILLNASIFNLGKFFRNNAGVKQYNKNKYEKAEKNFNENAVKDPTDPKLQYNLGNAYYKNNKPEEALSAYQSALRNSKFKQKDKVLQNIGNIYYNNKDYGQALEAYKQSLKINPKNQDVKNNYELAKQMMQEQQQQQQQNQDNKDQKKDKEEQQQQQQQEQKKDENKEQEQQQMTQEEKEKKDEADEQLKALQEQEQNDLKEKQKAKSAGRAKGKYW
ncbi:MAG: tetratricopeptide repeat protein [Candidatus Cloacimonetes bacterium]|nr:tetratricopeptide repeat protein [Candidatus Cloacimonadota bacterium]